MGQYSGGLWRAAFDSRGPGKHFHFHSLLLDQIVPTDNSWPCERQHYCFHHNLSLHHSQGTLQSSLPRNACNQPYRDDTCHLWWGRWWRSRRLRSSCSRLPYSTSEPSDNRDRNYSDAQNEKDARVNGHNVRELDAFGDHAHSDFRFRVRPKPMASILLASLGILSPARPS